MALIGSMSGSLTHLTDGSSYLIAGSGITLTSGSGDSITIASSAGSVAGSDTQYQYNNGGAFGGAADLTFNDSTGDTTVGASTGDAKLFFRDAGNYIWSESDGDLEVINNDGTAADSVKVTSTAGGVIIKAGKSGAGVLLLSASHADGGVKVAAGTGDVDINSDDAVTVDAVGAISIDAGAASNFTTSAGALTLAGESLDVDATGGAFNIAGTSASTVTTSGGALSLDGQTGVNIQENGTSVITISDARAVAVANATTVDIDGSGAISLNSSAAAINIGNDDVDQAINIGTDGTRTITIGEAADSTVTIKSLGGTLTLDGTGETVDLNSAALDIDASGAITIDGSSTVSIDAAGATNLTTTSGALTISGSAAGNLQFGNTLDIDSVGAMTIDSEAGISIDAGAASNLSTSAGALTVHGAGGINIGTTSDVAIDVDASTLDIDASGALTIDGASTVSIQGGGATDLQTSSGALTLAGESLDIDATSGAFNIAGTSASTVTTSGGALNLDGQVGVNIQEDGTTVIAVTNDREVAIGGVTLASDEYFAVSGSIGGKYTGSGVATFRGDTFVSGVLYTGQVFATKMSGSHTKLTDGTSAFIAGSNITITTGSSGAVTISASGGGGSVAGSDTQYQYNNGGSFGAAADLTFNDSTGDSTVGASTGDAKLFFRDAGNYIWSESDGDLEVINNDGTGNDSLKLTSTAGGVIINAGKTGAGVLLLTSSHAAGGITITAGTGDLDINSDDAIDIDAHGSIAIDSESTISIDGAGATNLSTSSGALTLAGETLDIDATSGAFNIAGTASSTVTTSGGPLKLDGQTGVQIQEDGTTVIGVDSDRNVAVGNVTNPEDVYFYVSGSVDSKHNGESHGAALFGGDVVISGSLLGGWSQGYTGGSELHMAGSPLVMASPDSIANTNPVSDAILFVSGVRTPLYGGMQFGYQEEGEKARAIFDSDVVMSGTVRGGYTSPTGGSMLNLRADLTVLGSSTVMLGGQYGGPGSDTSMFVSGSKTGSSGVSVFGGRLITSGNLLPGVDNSLNLGSATNRWANIYTGDLHLQNDRGNWTVIEEENYLTLRNNNNGKLFRLLMEEITD